MPNNPTPILVSDLPALTEWFYDDQEGCYVPPVARERYQPPTNRPTRIQRRRTPGWRKPPGAIDCTRPGKWGNPYRVCEYFYPEHKFIVMDKHGKFCGPAHDSKAAANAAAVELFKHKLLITLMIWPEYLEPLRGKDLLCWCKEGDVCHADELLARANEGAWVGI